MNESGIHIAITADAASADASVAALDERLAKLETAFLGAGKGAQQAGKDVGAASGLFSKLSSHLQEVEKHGNALSGIGNKLGGLGGPLKSVADKAGALGGALGMIPGPMMAITAGLAAVGAASGFLLSSAHKAALFQDATEQLRLSLRSAGQTQAGLTQRLIDFATVQEETTTYTRTQVVDSLAQFTTAGMNAAQAQAAMTAAENVAARTHVDVTRVVRSLEMAYHGNTASLQRYGIQVKDAQGKILPFNASMALLEQRFHGAAKAAGEAGEGPMTRLSHTFGRLQETVGALVLPILQKLADVLINVVDSAEASFKRWEASAHAFYLRNKQAFDAIAKVVRVAWAAVKMDVQVTWAAISGIFKTEFGVIMDIFTTFADLFTGHFHRLWGDVKAIFVDAWHNLTSGFGNFGDNLITIAERIGKAIANAFKTQLKVIGDEMHGNFAQAGRDLTHTFSGFQNLTAGLKWSMGGGGGATPAPTSATPDYGSSSFWHGMTAPLAHGGHAAHHGHQAAAGHKAAAEAAKKEHAALAALNAELRRYMAEVDLEAKRHKITIAQEIADLKHYAATHKLTADERIKVEQKITALETQDERLTVMAEKKKQLEFHKTELAIKKVEAAHKHLEAIAAAQARKETALLAKQQHAWQSYYKSLEHNAQAWTSKTAGWIDMMFQHGKKHTNSFAETFKKMLKEIEQALLKSLLFKLFMGGQGAKGGPSFMSLFASNMGFGGGGGAAPAGSAPAGAMGGGMGIASIATTALGMFGGKAGGALSGVLGMFGGQKGGAAGQGTTGGIIGALIGTAAASQLAASLPTDSIMSMLFGVGAPQAPGAGLGSGSGASGIGGASAVLASAAGPGGGTILGALTHGGGMAGIAENLGGSAISKGLGKILSGGLPSIMKALGFGQGSILMGTSGSLSLGGAGIGAIAGQLFGSLFSKGAGGGSHSIWGSIGGTIGGLFGGPVGGLIGAGLGSLFGHADNPANMPDKYDTQRYGTIISDLMGGTHGANGKQFTEQSQLASAAGGQSGIAWIEETLAKYAKPGTTQMGSNAPAWLQPMWSQLVSAFGVSASGSGKLNFGHAINNEWITGAQGVTNSGSNPLQYTDFGNLLNQFFENYITQGQLSSSPYTPGTNPNGGNSGFWLSSPFAGSYSINTPGGAPVPTTGSGLPPLNIAPGTGGGSQGVGLQQGTVGTGSESGTSATGFPVRNGGPGRRTGPAVNVTVNVAGSVQTEADLVARIRDEINQLMQRHQFSSIMALNGVGW